MILTRWDDKHKINAGVQMVSAGGRVELRWFKVHGPSGVVAHTLCARAPLAVWHPSGDTSVVYECGVNQR